MSDAVRRNLIRSGSVTVVRLTFFVVLIGLIDKAGLRGAPMLLVGTVLTLVSAAVWLTLFYVQDRREPEPKRPILRTFLFGALFASGAGLPILRDLYRIDEWLQGGILLRLGGLSRPRVNTPPE